MENNKIKELAKKYNLNKDDFWNLTGNVYIIKHDAVQKIAKIEKIVFENPTIVEHSREHCVLMGTATKNWKDKAGTEIYTSEWTFGEADKKTNCKNAYIFAMAEKRLKDRLTLKLVDAYEYGIYSDTEADEFKNKKKTTTTASGKQQEYVYKLLNHTAFQTGSGLELYNTDSLDLMGIFESQRETSLLINDLKEHIVKWEDYQKQGKTI
tara:strand:+ start:3537 stop:4163 length:627 start_codon:yes stop_codon:yes gene_type:complete